jgi:hypothetical protein
MTLADTIERLLVARPFIGPGVDFSYSNFEKEFLRRWKVALDGGEWKDHHVGKITKPLALVSRAIKAYRLAVKDNAHGEDSVLRGEPEDMKEAHDLAEMATTLAAHYRRQVEMLPPIDDLDPDEKEVQRKSQLPIRELAKWSTLMMEDCDIRCFIMAYEPRPLFQPVHVGNRTAARERMLFMQRMSAAMIATEGEYNDVVVAAITVLMYPKQTKRLKELEQAVAKQRGKMKKALSRSHKKNQKTG